MGLALSGLALIGPLPALNERALFVDRQSLSAFKISLMSQLFQLVPLLETPLFLVSSTLPLQVKALPLQVKTLRLQVKALLF